MSLPSSPVASPGPVHRRVRRRRGQAIGALALLALAFFVLSVAIRHPWLQHLDLRVTLAIQRLGSPGLDLLMEGLTFLGNAVTLIVLAAVVAAWFYRTGRHRMAAVTVLTLLGLPLDEGLKAWAHRPRPGANLVHVLRPATGLSFPSGHAMASTMFYGFLALLVWVHLPHSRWRRGATVGLACLPLGICLSRIYLGVHWLSDVLGGVTAGLFFLLVLAETHRAWDQGPPRESIP